MAVDEHTYVITACSSRDTSRSAHLHSTSTLHYI